MLDPAINVWRANFVDGQPQGALPNLEGRTILVIDDDPTVRDVMERFLTKEGFSVVLAEGADLILLVGGRLGEMPSQSYTLLDIPGDGSKLVHVHPGAEELNKVYRAGLGILATPHAFAAAAASSP